MKPSKRKPKSQLRERQPRLPPRKLKKDAQPSVKKSSKEPHSSIEPRLPHGSQLKLPESPRRKRLIESLLSKLGSRDKLPSKKIRGSLKKKRRK